MSEIRSSEILSTAVETLTQIFHDLEDCTEELYGVPGDLCEVAGTRVENFGRNLQREICFIQKLAEGAKILEEKV